MNYRRIILLVPALLLIGCASSRTTGSQELRSTYDRSEDVTTYYSSPIRLTQEIHLTRQTINLTVYGGCHGENTHCRPDDLMWEFDAPPEYAQYLGTGRLDFVVDHQYHTFETDVYQGRVGEVSASRRARFRIPFSFTERVAHAEDVIIKLGGNDIRLDQRRRAMLRNLVDAIQTDDAS